MLYGFFTAQVLERDGDAFVEEGHLPQADTQRIINKVYILKNFRVRPEAGFPCPFPLPGRYPLDLEVRHAVPARKFLPMHLAFAAPVASAFVKAR